MLSHMAMPEYSGSFARRFLAFCFSCPSPIANFRHVLTVLSDVMRVFNQLIPDKLAEIGGARTQMRQAINHIFSQVEAIDIVEHRHVKGRGSGALFFKAAHVQIFLVSAPISELMDQ